MKFKKQERGKGHIFCHLQAWSRTNNTVYLLGKSVWKRLGKSNTWNSSKLNHTTQVYSNTMAQNTSCISINRYKSESNHLYISCSFDIEILPHSKVTGPNAITIKLVFFKVPQIATHIVKKYAAKHWFNCNLEARSKAIPWRGFEAQMPCSPGRAIRCPSSFSDYHQTSLRSLFKREVKLKS